MSGAVRVGASSGHGTARGASAQGQVVPGTTSGYGPTRADSVGYTPTSPKNYMAQRAMAFGPTDMKAFQRQEQ
jgi:hypothetical protein